jgi:hypothetical protein
MPANRKVFAHLLAALVALLTCAFGIDFHEAHAGTFSLATQRQQKSGPAGVCYRPAQPAVPEHPPDIQTLGSDETKANFKAV